MRQTPHDGFFKFAFSFTQVYQDFFEQIPPKWFIDLLDLSTLKPVEGSFLTSKLQKYFADKLFSCQLKSGGEIIISCLIEHKSTVPPFIYDQLQRYVVEKHEADRKGKHARGIVVPIVLYHGKQVWQKQPPHAYFPNLPKRLRPFANAPDYILIDLRRLSKRKIMELRNGYLVNTLLVMKFAYWPAYLEKNVRDIFMLGNFYETMDEAREFLKGLLEYFIKLGNFDDSQSEKIVEDILENTEKPVKEITMTIEDYLIKKGRKEGKEEGIQEGIEKGVKKGIQEGKEELTIEFAARVIQKFPEWNDQQVAELVNLTVAEVKDVRVQLAGEKKNTDSKNGSQE